MELVLPEEVKKYFFDKLLKIQLDKFISINKDQLNRKSFSPILINSPNSYLSRLLIEKIFQFLFSDEKHITSNIEQKLNSNKNITFNVKISKNHIEVSPSEYGLNDRSIISEYLNEVSSVNNIVTGNKKNIIIWNIDKIGGIAFESLHNIIKNNEDTTNFITVSQSLNKIDRAIFNSVILLNVENPDFTFYQDFLIHFNFIKETDKVEDFLKNIKLGCSEYNFNSFLKNIAIFYNFKLKSLDNLDNTFHKFIETLYTKITSKNRISDSFVEEIRNLLYDLYVYHFTFDQIISLFIQIISHDQNITEKKKIKILELACFFSMTSTRGNKQIIHLEAFIYNFINIYYYYDDIDQVKKTRKIKA